MGMTIDNVLEILEKHKLHIPSNVFYELKADIVNFEEPTTKNEAKYCDRNICLKNEYNNVGCEDCEVTKSQESTKNDLGVDCISRAEAIKCLECDFDITGKENMKTVVNYINSAHDKIVNLPRVKQEPSKPMVEIDLYSVIKQKYIEREVLDKIRAEISTVYESLDGYDPDSLGTFVSKIDEIFDRYKAEAEADNG